jgi:hypothetical protein
MSTSLDDGDHEIARRTVGRGTCNGAPSMRLIGRTSASAFVAVAITVVTSIAGAQDNTAAAQARFDEGLSLLRANRFAEACPKLEESLRLEAASGTKYRLAECYEGLGRLAAALRLYREVIEETRGANRPDREQQVRAKIEKVEPRVPRVTIVVPPQLASLPEFRLEQDGVAITPGAAVEVDPGSRTFRATARGHRPWSTTVVASEGGALELQVPVLEPEQTSAPFQPVLQGGAPIPRAPKEDDDTVLSPGRIAGIAIGAAGVVGIGVGAGFGILAKSQWDDAREGCREGRVDRCDGDSVSGGEDAHTSAVVSTAAFIAGGVMLAGGVVLWFALPPEKSQMAVGVSPVAGASGGMVSAEVTW